MFLEHRLAFELKELGFVEAILPILIGDCDSQGVYTDFFASGCCPRDLPDVPVTAVEQELVFHMESQSLGLPILTSNTVRSVFGDLMALQGYKICGPSENAFCSAADSIYNAVKALNGAKSVASSQENGGNDVVAGLVEELRMKDLEIARLKALLDI
jgi:hypothetical protein